MKSQTAYTNIRKAMAATKLSSQPRNSERIYVNFKDKDPVEVMSMQAAWDMVKQNRHWEFESIEQWHNDQVDDIKLM